MRQSFHRTHSHPMPSISRLVRRALVAAAVLSIAIVPSVASAQGKSKGSKGGDHGHGGGQRVPPGQAKKKYTHAQAVDISREVLVANGYVVQRVDVVNGTRVIYYYRGNNGRGKGRGPLERIVVRPSAERYVFDGAPRGILSEIMRRMGL